MIIDEEDYLEHFGVQGMKWGVRKDSSNIDKQTQPKDDSKRNRNIKMVSSVAIGAVIVSKIIAKKGKTKIHDYGYTYPTIDIGPMGLGEIRFNQ